MRMSPVCLTGIGVNIARKMDAGRPVWLRGACSNMRSARFVLHGRIVAEGEPTELNRSLHGRILKTSTERDEVTDCSG